MGVYYCGTRDKDILRVHYIGRAKGIDVTIRSRLLDHLREGKWDNVTHFGYRICTIKKEAVELEDEEIQSLIMFMGKPNMHKQLVS